MWVIVAFVTGDVSAVPFSWILRRDAKILCFWPIINPRDKIKKNCKPPLSPDDCWELHECRILFNEQICKSYKVALQNEKYGQIHSNLESQEESDNIRAEIRKHPRTKFSCDSSDDVPEPVKRSKFASKSGKQPAKKRKVSGRIEKQPVERESSSDESDGKEYIFVKSTPKRIQNILHNTTDAHMIERNETFIGSTLKSIDGIDETATTSGQHITVTLEKVNETNGDVNQTPERHVDDISNDVNQANETINKLDVVTNGDVNRTPEQHVDVILENMNDIPGFVQLDSEPVLLNSSGTDNIFVETIDFSSNVLGKILQKVSEILQNQNDFKDVLVDLSYRMMKMEQRIKKLNATPTTAIVRQLGLPIKDPIKFAEVQVALEDVDNYEQLQTLASSFQAPSVNEFVKIFLKETLDPDFLYDHVVWRRDGTKVLIKDTKLARCMFDAIKVKFPALKEEQMESDAIVATRQVKDCYRRKKNPQKKKETTHTIQTQ